MNFLKSKGIAFQYIIELPPIPRNTGGKPLKLFQSLWKFTSTVCCKMREKKKYRKRIYFNCDAAFFPHFKNHKILVILFT